MQLFFTHQANKYEQKGGKARRRKSNTFEDSKELEDVTHSFPLRCCVQQAFELSPDCWDPPGPAGRGLAAIPYRTCTRAMPEGLMPPPSHFPHIPAATYLHTLPPAIGMLQARFRVHEVLMHPEQEAGGTNMPCAMHQAFFY